MKQATLKRSAPSSSKSRKKVQSLAGAGTAVEPFDLDGKDERESPIDVDAIDSEDAKPEAGPSALGPTSVKSRGSLPGFGPSTADPLNVVEPDFDVKASFADVDGQVILKDPDLDLLYFKRMSMSLRQVQVGIVDLSALQ
jgi:hypothetical protein